MKKSEKSAPDGQNKHRYFLKLYVAGNEQNSQLARQNLKLICNKYLKDGFRIEEIDVLTDFASALKDHVFVTPTLILIAPEPRVSIVGTLNDKEEVTSALRLRI